MKTHLATLTSASWKATSLRDSLLQELSADKDCDVLRIFAYAVTDPGWRELRSTVRKWLRARKGRSVVGYVGTDHAITEPDALRAMGDDGVQVRIMRKYRGTYHPKVFWLEGVGRNCLWVGSNNLTREGFLHNVEFALVLKSDSVDSELKQWLDSVDQGSELLDNDLLTNYEDQRQSFLKKRSSAGTFVWRKRQDPAPSPPAKSGDLIVEVMPLETGPGGKQMQIPKTAVVSFFGLSDRIRASKTITLSPVGTTESRSLKMTLFANNTARLSIHDLDLRDRPCVIVFHRTAASKYKFEIVKQSIFPDRYSSLIALCRSQTRTGSRRWVIV